VTRRVVRATPDFFLELDHQLGDERGPNGEPSAVDFATYELIPIIEEFATGWDHLAEQIPGRPEYRVLIKTGRLAPMISVVGQLAPTAPSNSSTSPSTCAAPGHSRLHAQSLGPRRQLGQPSLGAPQELRQRIGSNRVHTDEPDVTAGDFQVSRSLVRLMRHPGAGDGA
jgi:hypothetical protein